LLGISGIDCSGKSTLAKGLVSEAQERGVRTALVHVDDFIIPRAERKRGGPVHVDYFENTFNHQGFVEQVSKARDSGGVEVVIGEGIFLFRRELVSLWDMKVWLEMDSGESVRRGAVRDADYFGSPENARGEYLRRFVPAHAYHLERDRPMDPADLVFEVHTDGPAAK
jgi:uridine kinase